MTFPDDFATHSKVQKYYFDDRFMLQRIDYTAEVQRGRPCTIAFIIRNLEELSFRRFGEYLIATQRRIGP